jgi:hypothetical protein
MKPWSTVSELDLDQTGEAANMLLLAMPDA